MTNSAFDADRGEYRYEYVLNAAGA
jgi:hypothetical protein